VLSKAKVKHKMWPKLPGNPDVLIGNTALFVHGCFWHGCRKHYKRPKSNQPFWDNKIKRNVANHPVAYNKLRKLGYDVSVIWEHDLRK